MHIEIYSDCTKIKTLMGYGKYLCSNLVTSLVLHDCQGKL